MKGHYLLISLLFFCKQIQTGPNKDKGIEAARAVIVKRFIARERALERRFLAEEGISSAVFFAKKRGERSKASKLLVKK